jgi:hypothetical protein
LVLDVNSSGAVFAKSQVTDYALRGDGLSEYNVLEFFTDTYEEPVPRQQRRTLIKTSSIARIARGRPRNDRVPYQREHPKYGLVQRVMRSFGHNNLTNFIGRFFPRRDEEDTYPFYCANMLLLLKPWRNINTDLKLSTQTWESAFDDFMSVARRNHQNILSGIQYFHDCESSAKEKRSEAETQAELDDGWAPGNNGDDFEQEADAGGNQEHLFTEEGLQILTDAAIPWREALHARVAVELAKRAHIFPENDDQWDVDSARIGNATGDDLQRLLIWKNQMRGDVARQNTTSDRQIIQDVAAMTMMEPSISVDPTTTPDTANEDIFNEPNSEPALPAVEVSQLTNDQSRAYTIICWHLQQTLSGKTPPPLRMIMYGEGGTGKSRVIQTVTETFVQKDVPYMLIKAAYTGIAASLIKGKTTYFIGQFSIRAMLTMSDETKAKLQEIWRHASYLVIDEYSMISKMFLAHLSRNVAIGVAGSNGPSDHSFGGINVILCGDLHQFPPVATSIHEALFHPPDPSDSAESQLGYAIYQEFSTVVILKEQHRIKDAIWMDFLHHLRNGSVQDHHICMLKKQVIGSTEETLVDFDSPPWNDASLVTPRHAVRSEWNAIAVRKWCRDTGQQLYTCRAEDTFKGRLLTLVERYAVAARIKEEKRRKRKELSPEVELAIGMKVMVTSNVETDLDITNGARGEIVDIILHPDEPVITNQPIVNLVHMPLYILVKLTRTRATKLEGLDEAVIPVEPATIKFQIKVKTIENKKTTRTISRKQFPITPAYAFTDYRSQGQTISHVIVDIGKPPSGSLTLFNLYVALSRSSGRSTIRLLRDFDEDLFKNAHLTSLMMEDDRLEHLNTLTRTWWERVREKDN